MKAIILVGGQGTRMRPLTNHIPKNIVPLCGVPFLTYQVQALRKVGVREIVFSIGYRPQDIKKVFHNGKHLGVKIHYALENHPLGTAGAIKNCEKFVKRAPAIIFNGDILTDIPLDKMITLHKKKRHWATLGLVRVEDPTAYGLVLMDPKGNITKFLEKPAAEEVVTDTVNAGVYVFEPEVFDLIPPQTNYSAERALFPHLLKDRHPFGGYVWEGYWQDIGTPRKYLTSHWDVLNGSFPVHANLSQRANKIYIGKNVKMAKGVLIKGPAIIGDGCVIHEDARILPYAVLGKKCVIGKKSVVTKSVLWDGVTVGDHVHLEEVVLGRNCSISSHSCVGHGSVLGDRARV